MTTFPTPEDRTPDVSSCDSVLAGRIQAGDVKAKEELDYLNALADLNNADKEALYFGQQMSTCRGYLNEVNYERALDKAVRDKNDAQRKELVSKQDARRLSYFGYRLAFINALLRLKSALTTYETCKAKMPSKYCEGVDRNYLKMTDSLRYSGFDLGTFNSETKLSTWLDDVGELCQDAIAGRGAAILLEAYRQCQVGLYQPMHGSLYELVGVENGNKLNECKAAVPFTLIDNSWRTECQSTASVCSKFHMNWSPIPDVHNRPVHYPIIDALRQIARLQQEYALLNEPQYKSRRQEILERAPVADVERQLAACDWAQLCHRREFVKAHQAVQKSFGRLSELRDELKSFGNPHRGIPGYLSFYLANLGEFHKMVGMYNFVAASVISTRLSNFLCAEKGKVHLDALAKEFAPEVDADWQKRSFSRGKHLTALLNAMCTVRSPLGDDDQAMLMLNGVAPEKIDHRV